MLAVLQDAVLTLVAHAKGRPECSRRVVDEARRWVDSNSCDHPFAFAAICDVLGLDAGYVRAALRRLQAATPADSPYRRAYAGRGRHQVEHLTRSGLRRG